MPEKKKTTMSVTEMRKLLGLGKTDSYWLVHKNCFETIMVNGKMRIVIDSFEKWYANQIKHVKVDGPPPGEELRSYSYSVRDVAQMLSDRSPEELAQIRMTERKKEAPRLEVDPNKPSYNVRETAVLMDLTPDEVRQLIRDGKLAAKKYGATYIVRRETIDWWTMQQKLFAES